VAGWHDEIGIGAIHQIVSGDECHFATTQHRTLSQRAATTHEQLAHLAALDG